MGLTLGVVLALAVSSALMWTLGRKATGLAVLGGVGVAVIATVLVGQAFNLVMLMAGFAVLSALLTAVLERLHIHLVWRVVALFIVLFVAMRFLYWRGDVHAVPGAVSAALGTVIIVTFSFATRAAESSGARAVPPVAFVLGAAYLAWIALRLPNPGLASLVAFTVAAVLPVALWRGGGAAGPFLGPTLGALAWASGFYAWLGNASVVMVLAPVVIVLADVAWTLLRRVANGGERARLALSGPWWQRIHAWGTPGDDMVSQRLARSSSPAVAALAFLAATLVCIIAGLAGWYLGLGAKTAAAPLVVVGLAWLCVPLIVRKPETAPRRAHGTHPV